MEFVFKPFDAKTKESDGKRLYDIPGVGLLPSITTLLGEYDDGKWLEEWKQRVGAETAERESRQAARQGTEFHEAVETYLIENREHENLRFPHLKELFLKIKPFLDNNISKIHLSESVLFSKRYQMAGRVDLIADFDGKLSVVDFKTAKKNKKKEWIENYFLQTTAYSIMFQEMYHVPIEQIVILISPRVGVTAQCFIEDPKNFKENEFFYLQKRKSVVVYKNNKETHKLKETHNDCSD